MEINRERLKNRLVRAKSAIGHGCRYKLGKGGFFPKSSVPWDEKMHCDCSGFTAWVAGMRRDQINAKKWWSKLLPWFETTMIYRDAIKTKYVFTAIDKPTVGCFVVLPDIGPLQGHIGIVSYVYPGENRYSIVDCRSKKGEAIQEHDGAYFYKKAATKFVILQEDLVLRL